MKLIIDVDEKLVCEGFERNFTEEERDVLIRAIGNGTPYEEKPQGYKQAIRDGKTNFSRPQGQVDNKKDGIFSF